MADSSKITAKLEAAAAAASSSSGAATAQPNAGPVPLLSLEFFPPKTNSGLANLYARILRMTRHLAEHGTSGGGGGGGGAGPTSFGSSLDGAAARGSGVAPAWVNITWGAGGTTQDRSLSLAARVQNGLLSDSVEYSMEELDQILCAGGGSEGGRQSIDARDVCLHLTCTNVTRESLELTLKKAKQYGIRNILALRGDSPRGSEYWTPADASFQQATDLIRFIREHYADYFCIGVAGYPESHPDAPSPNDLEGNVAQLKSKQDCGADFVVTQLFYDVEVFVKWYRRCREAGITIPIIPGIMPIQNYQSFKRMAHLCKATIPPRILSDLEPIKNDDAAIKQYGIQQSVGLVRDLKRQIPEMAAFHFCTVNLEKSILAIIDQLGWAGAHRHEQDQSEHNRIISDKSGTATPSEMKITTNAAVANIVSKRSSLGEAASLQGDGLRKAALLSSQASAHSQGVTGPAEGGVGSASWDEFPNGRYGDSRSPAYGEMDGYGVSLKVPPAEALKLWGTPTTHADISAIFASYLLGKASAIPWCDLPIFNETMAIRNYLLALNLSQPKDNQVDKTLAILDQSADAAERELAQRIRARSDVVCKGWWTVGSQPAVAGISSADPTYGFGPRDGYVFQKAFVEFFVEERCKKWLLEKIEREGNGKVTFFAGNSKGEFETNVEPGGVNAVTWAVFPGKEIVQSTIIEEESFKAWRDEAFEIWGEWACLYPPQSASRKLLDNVRETRWLVTVVHHDFKDEKALWKFLGCAVIDDQAPPAAQPKSSSPSKDAAQAAQQQDTNVGGQAVALRADDELVGFIKSRITAVREKIAKAHRYAKQHGSKSEAPRLVAVSKLQTPTSILAAYKGAGQVHFGENYVQEMIDKAKVLPKELKWHFVGGLQSNKAKLLAAMPNLHLLETLDSVKAANALQKALTAEGAPKREELLRVYIQVNTSREEAKSGVMPLPAEDKGEDGKSDQPLVDLAVHILTKCPSIQFAGLMTIGSASNSRAEHDDITQLPPEQALHLNPDFDTLIDNRRRLVRLLRQQAAEGGNKELGSDDVRTRYPSLLAGGGDDASGDETGGLELSMGMSADVDVATVAGSNNVRVGTDCFSQRPGTRDEAMERMKGELENGVEWVE
ncbi:methylenetetrahydrofolate reductase 1 [Tilletia horrida]|nr:methylenetetrahydrofolate reductase 1 [Tilletia horrida]